MGLEPLSALTERQFALAQLKKVFVAKHLRAYDIESFGIRQLGAQCE